MFHTGDGGRTWEARNRGTRCDYLPEEQRYPETGQCVHHLAMAPGMPDRLYQQNHCGMYRSDDGGRQLGEHRGGPALELRLPADAHPRDPDTLFLLPLNGDSAGRYPPEASTAVWRTRDAGRSWQRPARRACRSATPTSPCCARRWPPTALEPAGVYFGTNTGSLFASADEGESWACVAQHLPTVLSVETLVVGRVTRRSGSACPRRWSSCSPAPSARWRCAPPPWPSWSTPWTPAGRACAIACATRRPRLRRQINVFVDGERAGLDTPLRARATG